MVFSSINNDTKIHQKRVFLISNMYPSYSRPSYGIFVKKLDHAFQEHGFLISGRSYLLSGKQNFISKVFQYVYFNIKTVFLGLIQPADFYYCHFPTHSFFSLLVFKILGKNIVVNYHGSDLMSPSIFRKFINNLVCYTSKLIVAPSQYFKKQLLLKAKFTKDKVVVFPSCGVDFRKFPLKDKASKENAPFCFGFISNLIPGKGINEFIDSFIKLSHLERNIYALIIGSGPLLDSVLEKINDSGFKDKFEIMGTLKNEDLSAQLNKMDVLVFASKLPESLGLVPIEALATGTPVIAGNHGAMPEYVSHKNGVLVDDVSSISNLYSAMKYVMENNNFEPKSIRNTIQKYSHTRVLNIFFKRLNDKF